MASVFCSRVSKWLRRADVKSGAYVSVRCNGCVGDGDVGERRNGEVVEGEVPRELGYPPWVLDEQEASRLHVLSHHPAARPRTFKRTHRHRTDERLQRLGRGSSVSRLDRKRSGGTIGSSGT